MTWPAFTGVLKSASSSRTWPESCEPTSTVVTGCTVPVAETLATMAPRSMRVVRQGGEVFVWLNDCPHEHRPMEFRQDQFLSGDGGHIVCYAHSAHFDLRSGHCFAGPCVGQHLIPVPAQVRDGAVWIADELPTPFD